MAYSFTRSVIDSQLATTQSRVRKLDNTTNRTEMPSTPRWNSTPRPGIQAARCTNWNSAVPGSNAAHSASDSAKVNSVVHRATARTLRTTYSAGPEMTAIIAAPRRGTPITTER